MFYVASVCGMSPPREQRNNFENCKPRSLLNFTTKRTTDRIIAILITEK